MNRLLMSYLSKTLANWLSKRRSPLAMSAGKQVCLICCVLLHIVLMGELVKLYFSGLGGNHQAAFWLSFVGGLVIYMCFNILEPWFLGYWARQYEERPASEVKVP